MKNIPIYDCEKIYSTLWANNIIVDNPEANLQGIRRIIKLRNVTRIKLTRKHQGVAEVQDLFFKFSMEMLLFGVSNLVFNMVLDYDNDNNPLPRAAGLYVRAEVESAQNDTIGHDLINDDEYFILKLSKHVADYSLAVPKSLRVYINRCISGDNKNEVEGTIQIDCNMPIYKLLHI